jgi:hypothetical protein
LTKTVQPRSGAFLHDAGKDMAINKPEKEDNIDLLLNVFDELNILYERLNRLNYAVKRKKIEQILHQKGDKK